MSALCFEHVSFGYLGQELLLSDVNFSLEKGTCTLLEGPSGSGKSTICHLACGIIPRNFGGKLEGRILLDGEPLPDKPELIAGKVGIVFQNPETQLFLPYVEDELAFGPENFCMSPEKIEERISNTLKEVGIEGLRYKKTNELSGGQKQLVAIASVHTLAPEVLILDEVMSQLDGSSTKRIRELIAKLREEGNTLLLVDHDLEDKSMVDQILRVTKSGIVCSEGVPGYANRRK
ncbi:ABC transporter ATP-binding protein [Clostridia bacterium]|nr:ABC transporter ATP-binding protein [Clostridia bacterium]